MRRMFAIACLVLISRSASAWDSHGETDVEGPPAAKQRMISPNGNDEHRQIWIATLALAGAPADADSDMTLATFTANDQSLQPVRFGSASRLATRVHSPSEFAQLPDFSYSLWDWALGNETCPLGSGIDLGSCHQFTGHMGAVNSNHFVPQTATHYARYHQLAMSRAADCGDIRTKIGTRTDLAPFLRACVGEALALEAIGHHFLQDSWSTGHMWQRWGSPDLSDFADFNQARAVGGISGLIHGSRGVLQALAPSGVDVNDALCAPNDRVSFSSSAGQIKGIGDLYLGSLQSSGTYGSQYSGMYACAVGGVRAVLSAAGEMLGPPGVAAVDPGQNPSACFGMRATNEAMAAAYAIDFNNGTQRSIDLEVLATGVSIFAATNPLSGVSSQVTFDILRVGALTRLRAFANPTGTEVAQGAAGRFLNVNPNATYDHLGAYVDPLLPWPGSATTNDSHELALARVFHAAHAKDWCEHGKPGDAELDLEQLRTRAMSSTGNEADATCTACSTFVQRHLRIGDAATYVPSPATEPLCGLIARTPSQVHYVYEADPTGIGDRARLARRFCGCDRVIDGDVNLTTQASVDALAGITEITGYLWFPLTESATDPALDLSPLSSLRRIGGQLLIVRSGFTSVASLTLPALAEIGGELTISGTYIANAPTGSLTTVSLPALTSLGGRFNIQISQDPAPVPATVSAPALVVSGPFAVFMAPGLTTLTVAGVTTMGDFFDSGFSDCPDLATANLGTLMIARDFFIGPNLGSLTMLQGTGSIGRDLVIQGTGLTSEQIGQFERGLTIGRNAVPDFR